MCLRIEHIGNVVSSFENTTSDIIGDLGDIGDVGDIGHAGRMPRWMYHFLCEIVLRDGAP